MANETGSGVTTGEIVAKLQRVLAEQFAQALDRMPMGTNKTARDKKMYMTDGFKDGARSMLNALVDMGVVSIVND